MLKRYIPSNFKSIFALSWRLIFQGQPAGRAAMIYSTLGVLLAPLDLILSYFEKRLYRDSVRGQQSQIFVCGAPRSGTTVVAQTLIKYLPVFYLSNLTSLFPRSPIMANKLFSWALRTPQDQLPLRSFYGRTTKLSYPNDALYIWDRWTKADRSQIPTVLGKEVKQQMIKFFSAVENYSNKPLVNKNNSLNTFAHLVAEVLPNAYFICLDRNPVYLAQSHYIARKFIHGDEHSPYGIFGENEGSGEPIKDICKQIFFHKKCALDQLDQIGSDRFIILPYEDFCAQPAHWVCKLSEHILGQKLDEAILREKLSPLQVANLCKVDLGTFANIRREIELQKIESRTTLKIAER